MITPADSLNRFTPLARTVFAACFAALGVVHVISGEAVTRLFPVWPAGLPGRPYWAHAGGMLLVLFGGMILLRIRARLGLTLIGFLVLLSVLMLHLPRSIPTGEFGDAWLNVCKWLAMAVGAFLMAATIAPAQEAAWVNRVTEFFANHARWFLAAFLLGAGILHVRFAGPIAQYYIPAYIPARLFWTYFTAGALAAGGIGLLLPPTTRVAGLLAALMISLWCPLLHIPRTWAAPHDPAEWCGVFESLAFAAIVFLVAARSPARSEPGDS